jgi:hypothetical protein
MVQELNGREKRVHIDVEKYRHGLNYTTKPFEALLLTVVATMWYTLKKFCHNRQKSKNQYGAEQCRKNRPISVITLETPKCLGRR